MQAPEDSGATDIDTVLCQTRLQRCDGLLCVLLAYVLQQLVEQQLSFQGELAVRDVAWMLRIAGAAMSRGGNRQSATRCELRMCCSQSGRRSKGGFGDGLHCCIEGEVVLLQFIDQQDCLCILDWLP